MTKGSGIYRKSIANLPSIEICRNDENKIIYIILCTYFARGYFT